MSAKISIIAGVSDNGVIGHGNSLPWHISKDLKRFRELTSEHPVIMGRKTYESIGHPLPRRTNYVVTRNADFHPEGVIICESLEQAIEEAKKVDPGEVFIIGGGQIYEQALPLADKLYITQIHADFDGDTRFPDYSNFGHETFREENEEEGIRFTFLDLEK